MGGGSSDPCGGNQMTCVLRAELQASSIGCVDFEVYLGFLVERRLYMRKCIFSWKILMSKRSYFRFFAVVNWSGI